MKEHSELFIGLDVSKLKTSVAFAEDGRDGEVRFFGDIDASPASIAALATKLAKGRVQTRVTLSWSESISDTRFPSFFRNEYRHDFIPVGRGQSVQRCSQGPCNFIAVES
jgi:hypothetical protein